MPNWCANTTTVTGPKADRDAFLSAVTNPEGVIALCDLLLPFPTELEGREITGPDGTVVGRAFTNEGRDWCLQNWGTKWGDCDTNLMAHNDETTVVFYDTAWSPMDAGLVNISRLYPTLTFVTVYDEPGMAFMGAGRIVNGEILAGVETEYPVCEDWDDENAVADHMDNLVFMRDQLRAEVTNDEVND